jgi:pimeloyl-ACP methyl ester carboxylesterase
LSRIELRPLPVIACLLALLGCEAAQRSLLYHPTHHANDRGLARWTQDGTLIGFAREVPSPRNVWLMLHGNGGQAADRTYALRSFAADDSVFILEYPGYGQRPGKPSRKALDAAARDAYALLRTRFPQTPICVVAESIGSGPAATLGSLDRPPDKFVFIVPFESLAAVGNDYVSSSLASPVLAGTWTNAAALAGYQGPLEVFGARHDEIIPVRHAQALAKSRPQATFHLIDGGHNDWASQPAVRIRN